MVDFISLFIPQVCECIGMYNSFYMKKQRNLTKPVTLLYFESVRCFLYDAPRKKIREKFFSDFIPFYRTTVVKIEHLTILNFSFFLETTTYSSVKLNGVKLLKEFYTKAKGESHFFCVSMGNA